jgi:exopolysaccharide biosynthesis predicted pyruvyltransferase EpsI
MSASDIEQYLRSLPRGEPVYFVPNPGNGGDSLIAHATFQLFRKLKIEYRLFDWKTCGDLAERTLIYGGGGNLVRYYDDARTVIQKTHRSAGKLVVLPHTIEGNEDLLGELGPNVDVICREETSYRHVARAASKANVLLMHDVAFELDPERTLAEKPRSLPGAVARKVVRKLGVGDHWRPEPSPRVLIKDLGFDVMQRLDRLGATHDGTLNCFRTDVERSGPIPEGNLDLSSIFSYGTEFEELAAYTSFRLLEFIRRYSEIRTNRLHLCIAGALMGVRVKLHPNANHKCRAVYQFSIENRYPSVEWMGA